MMKEKGTEEKTGEDQDLAQGQGTKGQEVETGKGQGHEIVTGKTGIEGKMTLMSENMSSVKFNMWYVMP